MNALSVFTGLCPVHEIISGNCFPVLADTIAVCLSGRHIPVSASDTKEYHDLSAYLQAVNDPKGVLSISTVRGKNFVSAFKPLNDTSIDPVSPVQWLRLYVQNQDTLLRTCYISITFTDYIEFYIRQENGENLMKKSGDLVPLYERDVKIGQMVFIAKPVPPQSVIACYARMESQTAYFSAIACHSA